MSQRCGKLCPLPQAAVQPRHLLPPQAAAALSLPKPLDRCGRVLQPGVLQCGSGQTAPVGDASRRPGLPVPDRRSFPPSCCSLLAPSAGVINKRCCKLWPMPRPQHLSLARGTRRPAPPRCPAPASSAPAPLPTRWHLQPLRWRAAARRRQRRWRSRRLRGAAVRRRSRRQWPLPAGAGDTANLLAAVSGQMHSTSFPCCPVAPPS